jgi:hypothetical protein
MMSGLSRGCLATAISSPAGRGRPLARLAGAALSAALLGLSVSACGSATTTGGSTKAATQSASSTSSGEGEAAGAPSASLGPSSGEVIAQVGSVAITKGEVNHWMSTLTGGDYYELSHGHTVPEGLASDPPRYGACVARLEAAAAASPHKVAQLTGVQLLTKCRQIYSAIKAQAAALLVAVEYVFGLAEEEGLHVSDAEVLAAYKQDNAERFSNPAQLASYRTARRVSLADELLLTKKNLLSAKLLTKLKRQPGGSLGRKILASEAAWRAKISCRPGYVVEHCKQFHGAPAPTAQNPPASVLMEQVTALATGICVNKQACGKE